MAINAEVRDNTKGAINSNININLKITTYKIKTIKINNTEQLFSGSTQSSQG